MKRRNEKLKRDGNRTTVQILENGANETSIEVNESGKQRTATKIKVTETSRNTKHDESMDRDDRKHCKTLYLRETEQTKKDAALARRLQTTFEKLLEIREFQEEDDDDEYV